MGINADAILLVKVYVFVILQVELAESLFSVRKNFVSIYIDMTELDPF